jgi:hypothetical protein
MIRRRAATPSRRESGPKTSTRPRGRPEQVEDTPDRRRLAASVRPKEGEDLGPPDVEIDALDGMDQTVILDETPDLEDRRIGGVGAPEPSRPFRPIKMVMTGTVTAPILSMVGGSRPVGWRLRPGYHPPVRP